MKLTVHLVIWNGAKYLPYLFKSLRNQTFKDWELIVLDNNSSDNSVELVIQELNNWSQPKKFIKNLVNTGFAGGHNQIYAATDSEYFLLLNQDFYLQPDCLEKLVEEIKNKPAVAVVSPRLMTWNFAEIENNGLTKSLANTIDSLGLKVLRNRRVIELGAGEKWSGTEQKTQSVFGVSGAAPLFRRAHIEQIAFSDQEFFDNSYGSYKEDVDLAWRLQASGFGAEVVLDAVIYHDRSVAGPVILSDQAAGTNKKRQSDWVQYQSYKNHLMTLFKNEYWQNLTLDFFFILWYELKKFVWFLLFKPTVLKGLGEIWCLRKELNSKRKLIKSKRKIAWQQLRQWWS